ncbi:hypothetical protein PIOMA14_I_0033 [Prevotella intermedia]|uniref:Uncharacterized protein n=1 Tax=Prevotella intermedia TaxID=28131 RepID=A0A0S3UGL5_PREIN|nr:hypothetical protein PIOMA14_I_0033 [Prevotella intermedia]
MFYCMNKQKSELFLLEQFAFYKFVSLQNDCVYFA